MACVDGAVTSLVGSVPTPDRPGCGGVDGSSQSEGLGTLDYSSIYHLTLSTHCGPGLCCPTAGQALPRGAYSLGRDVGWPANLTDLLDEGSA